LLIVVLGGLAAIAVVSVNSMTGSDSTTANLLTTTSVSDSGAGVGLAGVAQSAAAAVCHAEAGAATSASSVYFASSGGRYPTKWPDLATASLVLPPHVVVNPNNPAELDGNGWKLTMSGGRTAAPTFACK